MAQPTRKLENLLTTFNSTLSGLFICHAHRRKEGRGNGARRLRENFSALSALSERAAGKKTSVFLFISEGRSLLLAVASDQSEPEPVENPKFWFLFS